MGFDIECIIDVHTYPGEYFCPVCRTLVFPSEALQTVCTHLYCKHCLTYVSNARGACPYDGCLVTETESIPLIVSDETLAESIGKVKVRCLYHKSGCSWEGPFSECTSHCSGCYFGNSPVICYICGVQVVHRQMHEHAQSCLGTNGYHESPSSGSLLPVPTAVQSYTKQHYQQYADYVPCQQQGAQSQNYQQQSQVYMQPQGQTYTDLSQLQSQISFQPLNPPSLLKPQMHAQTQQHINQVQVNTQQWLPPTQTQIQFHPRVSRCQPCFSLSKTNVCPGCIIGKYISSPEELKLLPVRFTADQLRRRLQFLEDAGSSYVVIRFWIEDVCVAISEMKKVEEVEKELENLQVEVKKLKEEVEQHKEPFSTDFDGIPLFPDTIESAAGDSRAESREDALSNGRAEADSREDALSNGRAEAESREDALSNTKHSVGGRRGKAAVSKRTGRGKQADDGDDPKDADYVPSGWRRSTRHR